jgi:hypothetical protein
MGFKWRMRRFLRENARLGAMLTFAAQNIYFTLLILHDGVKLKFKCSFSAAVFCATAS